MLFQRVILLIFLLNSLFIYGQIPNGGFEQWQTVQLCEEPVHYTTSNGQTFQRNGSCNVYKVPSPTGQAVHLETVDLNNDTIPGILLAGDVNQNLTVGGGVPLGAIVNASTTANISARWNIQPNDTALILVILTDYQETTRESELIGFFQLPLIGNNASTFVNQALEGQVLGSADADSAIVIIQTGRQPGSWLEVDAFNFQNIDGSQLGNHLFEDWDQGNYLDLTNWRTLNGAIAGAEFGEVPTKRITDAQSGNYAMRLETKLLPNSSPDFENPDSSRWFSPDTIGSISIGQQAGAFHYIPGMAVMQKPYAISGAYKYFPVENDSARITLALTHYHPDSNKRTIVALTTIQLGQQNFYESFNSVIDYTIDLLPDSAFLLVESSSLNHGGIARNGSILILDDLRFSGLQADAGPDINVCSSQSLTIGGNPSVVGGSAPYNYQWMPTTGLDNPNKANPILDATTSRCYTLSVTDADGNSSQDIVCVSVGALSLNAGAHKTICNTDSKTFMIGGSPTVSGGTEPYAIHWEPSTGLSSATQTNPTASVSESITYSLRVEDAEGCVGIDSITILVSEPMQVDAGPDDEICATNCYHFSPTVSGGQPPYAYFWAASEPIQDPLVLQATSCPSNGAAYQLNVMDANNCPASDQVVIRINPIPNPVIIGDTSSCEGEILTLKASGGDRYFWEPNGATSASITVETLEDIAYKLTAFSEKNCQASILHAINVYYQPLDDTIYIEGEVGETVYLDGGNDFAQYTWSNGSTDRFFTIDKLKNGSRTYIMTGMTSDGCSADLTFIVSGTLGNNVFFQNELVELRPNPAHHFVEFNRPLPIDLNIQFVDLLGKEQQKLSLSQGSIQMDISSLKAGVYHCMITNAANGSSLGSIKIVKL